VKALRKEARAQMEVVSKQTLELRLMKKKHARGLGTTMDEISSLRKACHPPRLETLEMRVAAKVMAWRGFRHNVVTECGTSP